MHDRGAGAARRGLLRGLARIGAALAASACACVQAAPPPVEPAAAPRAAEAVPVITPARYLVADSTWIERADGGLDRAIANGRRVEVRGQEIAWIGPAEPEIEGGAAAPPWAPRGPSRYVFWKGKELWGAETFTGELRKIATLPAAVSGSFDWLGGVGITLPGGALVVPPSGGAPAPLGVAAAVHALAADGKRAAIATIFGRVWLTTDGARFRDASADLGGATRFEVRGDHLALRLHDGRERFVDASGAIVEARPGIGAPRGKPASEEASLWPGGSEMGALQAAVTTGLPLPDGGAVVTSRGFVGRFDLTSHRTTSLASIEGLGAGSCEPFRAEDALLLVCVATGRATVVDLTGAPRVERTFELAAGADLDRFTGSDGDALGFLGPCEGAAPVEAPRGDDPYNVSTQRSRVFCARARRDEWIEHRLAPADASDVIAWMARPGGGAVALVARPGTFLDDRERVTQSGPLRVVRVARGEPPLSLPQYRYGGGEALNRSLRVGADDVIEGWLPTSVGSSMPGSFVIDARGRVRANLGPPRVTQSALEGPFGLAATEDGRLFETTDRGRRWIEVEPPPGVRAPSPSACSPVGCRVGPYVRLGWSTPAGAGAELDDASRSKALRERSTRYQRPPLAPPLVRIGCRFDAPPEGKRIAESYAFGYTKTAQPRGPMQVRVGSVGVATVPWGGSTLVVGAGDVDLAWVPLLDLAAPVKRASIAPARVGISGAPRVYELKLGYLLEADGGLGAFPIGYRDQCLGGLLEAAGIARSLGACAEDRAVGVDLGGRVIVVHPSWDAVVVSAADGSKRAASRAIGARGAASLPVALRELSRARAGGSPRGFLLGAGARDGAPVAIAVDVVGAAALAPIDRALGALSAEEPLRALTSLALGTDPACAGARPGEARVVLPFEGEIGLDRAELPGVLDAGTGGVAMLRWSRDRVCLDAIELAVKDERFDENPSPYDQTGVLRKVIARFGAAVPGGGAARAGAKGAGVATLVLVSNGAEVRQRLACDRVSAGRGDTP